VRIAWQLRGRGAYTGADGNLLPFVADEKNGTWGRATLIPGISGHESEAGSVSCPTAGNCAADGFVLTGGALEPFTVAQANGTWDTAAVVPGITSLNVGQNAGAASISCAAPGSCAAAGTYIDARGDVPSWLSSTNGQGAPRDVPGLAALTGTSGFSRITAVSCRSAGNCTVTGQFSTSLRGTKAFVVSEVNGTWGNAIEVPGITAISGGSDAATASAVSCATAGNCAAGGVYDDSNPTPAEHVFVAVQAGGAWGNAQQLTGTGTKPALSSVSCATPGNCAFGGSGTDASGHVQGFVADLSAAAGAGGQVQTTTSLALSAPTVTFGQEQAGQISVTVTAASGGAPRGVVTVTANKATVCLIVLGSGTGSCRLTPKGLRPGRYALTARFFGGLGFAGSASVPAALTVTR
jgi:Big-like domain-containing protein